jgi:hypothetical protein
VSARNTEDDFEHPCGCYEFLAGDNWCFINCQAHGGGSGFTPLESGRPAPEPRCSWCNHPVKEHDTFGCSHRNGPDGLTFGVCRCRERPGSCSPDSEPAHPDEDGRTPTA